MSRRRKPDIVFTEPVQHHETPRERLYNSRRRLNAKRTFGMVSMIVGVAALLMFIFPLVTFPFGFLGVIFAFVAFGIKTDGRDVGHHMATAGMWCSVVSLVLAAVFAIMGIKRTADESKTRDEQQAKLVESVTGVWKSTEDNNMTIEFTPGGNMIYAELASDEDDAERLNETAGLYQITDTNLVVAFGSRSTKFTWEILPNQELYVVAPSDRDIRLPLSGKWRKIKSLKFGIDYEAASPEMKKYFKQLDEYTSRKVVLIDTLVKYKEDKKKFVADLNEYRTENKERDDRWRVLGQDLKSTNSFIDLINERIATIDRVIVRLQGVIRNQGREEDIARLGMTDTELAEILETSHRLEDELKIKDKPELLNDDEIETMVKNAANESDDIQSIPNQ